MQAATAVLLFCSFLPFVRGSIHGNLTIYSTNSIVSQPYPVEDGIRTTVEQPSTGVQFECTLCDAGAPTEHCFKELGVCVALADTAISVIGRDGFPLGIPQPLNPECSPRYLQMVRLDTIEMVVVCHDFHFHLVMRTGSTFELDSIQQGIGQGGIVIKAPYWNHPSLYLIELDGSHIYESNPFAGIPRIGITPQNNCTEYLSLYPLHTREKFLLWCNTTTGKRVYVVNRSNREDAPSVELDSAPVSSPDGSTFAAVTGSTFKLYRSERLGQYPGVKDFSADITFCTYLTSGTVVIGLEGRGQTLVYVEAFINSVGAEGLTTLPYTSSYSPIYKLITQDVYATSNETGTLYNVLLFNISSGQTLDPVSSLLEEPVNIFFQRGTAPDPPPMPEQSPTSQLFSTANHTATPTPTPPQVARTSFASALQSSQSVQSPTPTKDTPTKDPAHQELEKVIFLVVALLFLLIAVLVCALFLYFYWIKQRKRSWFGKTCPPFSHGPIEETNQENNGTTWPSPLGQDDSSSGRGTLTHSSISSNASIKSFVSTAPSIPRSNSGDLPFPQSIQESKVV